MSWYKRWARLWSIHSIIFSQFHKIKSVPSTSDSLTLSLKMMKQVIIAFAVFAVVAARPQKDKEVTITRSEFDDQGDGTFSWVSELSDGSKQEQSGKLKQIGEEQGIALTGSYSYYSPEGQLIEVKYVADENGFQPTGDHLPTSPPIPEAIQKALDIILRNAGQQQAAAAPKRG